MALSPFDPRARALQGMMRGMPSGAPSLGDIFAPPPRPVAVSPGSPAPVQPGVDIQAQRPILSARTPPPPGAMAPAEQAVGDAQAADAARGAEDQFAALYDKMRERSQAALRTAETDAKVDPEQTAMLDRQEARFQTDRADIEKEKRLSDWDALASLGFTMAQSNSPFFTTALAEGLQAGTKGFSESRANRARAKALLADREDQVAQARYAALKGARDEARQRVIDGANLTQTEVRTAAMTNEAIEKKATSQSAIKKVIADADKARTDADNADAEFGLKSDLTRAQIGSLQASAAESYAGADAYRDGRRGGRGGAGGYDIKDLDKASDEYSRSIADANKARREWHLAGRRDKAEKYTGVMAAQEKALIATNAMRRIKGQGPLTLAQLFPRGNQAAERALAAPSAAPDPLGIR